MPDHTPASLLILGDARPRSVPDGFGRRILGVASQQLHDERDSPSSFEVGGCVEPAAVE